MVLFDLQGGPVRRGRPRTAALRQKSVRVFLPEASVRRGVRQKRIPRPPTSNKTLEEIRICELLPS